MIGRKTTAQPNGTSVDDSADSHTHRRARPGVAAAVMAMIALALITTAMVFTIASGTTDTASEGEVGILSEASLGAAAAARNGIAQAQVLAEAHDLGVATLDQRDLALQQAATAATELGTRIDRLTAAMKDSAASEAIQSAGTKLTSLAETAAANIRSGDLAGSAELIEGEIDASYHLLAGQLAATRDTAMARIALAGEDSGRIADAARFLVVLLVPVTVLLTYRKRVRREQEQLDLEHRLEKQQAVGQAQDEFIANLSHELRTPLTAIYGFSLELIEPGRAADPEFERELATYIATESADLSRMVEDILTAASADQDGLSISIGEVDAAAEINSVLGALRATGARIDSDVAAAWIKTDPLRFRQIIRNLVSNALRHGGPNNLVAGRIDGEHYTVQVRDDGPGIPESLEDRLFTRFIHQGNEPLLTGSVGLGLAIARLLTDLTGGTITYRRDRGETVFAVTFPVVDSKPMPQPYVYKPRWRDREPVNDSRSPAPGSRPPKPDLKNFGPPKSAPVEQHPPS